MKIFPFSKAFYGALVAVLLLAAATGGYIFRTQWKVHLLEKRIEEQRREFETRISRLLHETRRAQFRVLSEREENGVPVRTIRFIEFAGDDPKDVVATHEFEMKGSEIYVDAVQVYYTYDLIQAGKQSNFALFRRVFSDVVPPAEGYKLYPVSLNIVGKKLLDEVPKSERTALARQLSLLRGYLESPKNAKADGVRIVDVGEAKYTNPRTDSYYEILQKADGGLLLEAHPTPPIFQ